METRREVQYRSEVLTIIPAYNEEAAIGGVIKTIRLYYPLTDILVVDDGSTDRTSSRALAAGAEVLRLPTNLGVGAAQQVALRFAAERGYSYVMRLDADGQHDADDAFRLLTEVMEGKADAAIGSRFLGSRWLGKDRNYRIPLSRKVGIRIFAALVSALIGQHITDPTSGLRCYNREIILYLSLHHPQDYPEVESIVLLHRAGFRLVELPATIHPRCAGHTSIGAGKAIYYVLRVLLAASTAALRTPPPRIAEEEIYVAHHPDHWRSRSSSSVGPDHGIGPAQAA
jgi:glycosyltransferase involved in cell wall biosynthesis